MAWYAYCIGEKQAFPELARHRKPIPMESLLGVSGNQVFLYPANDLACIIHEHMTKAFCGGTRLPKMLMAP
jgi:hypothetical protein